MAVWNDIRKQSAGVQERIEDRINYSDLLIKLGVATILKTGPRYEPITVLKNAYLG